MPNPAELLNGDLALSNRVRVQVPIELLAPHANLIIRSPIWLFTPAGKRYALAHPAGSDLLLAVEVA